MSNSRKAHFDRIASESIAEAGGIWELPDHILDEIGGGLDWTQSQPGGGYAFAQNFSCFAQNIGNFSQGRNPLNEHEDPGTGV